MARKRERDREEGEERESVKSISRVAKLRKSRAISKGQSGQLYGNVRADTIRRFG